MSRRGLATVAAVALAATLAAAASGCSSEERRQNVAEGFPVFLGNLEYNVQISRFLNPSDDEDVAYLEGAPPLPRDSYYLGIFLQVHNHGSKPAGVPTRYAVTDTDRNVYLPVAIDNDFTMPLDGTVGGGGQIPGRETIAANGPIEGLMLLFIIKTPSVENRPLTLRIPAAGNAHPARIELDL